MEPINTTTFDTTSQGPASRHGQTARKSVLAMLLGFILLCTIVVAMPASPLYMSFPGRDSGVFLYIGDQILQGNLPYRDAWDHKAPGIYYLNALGLWIGAGTVWGVWALELTLLALATLACFSLLNMSFNTNIAFYGSLAFLGSLILVLQGGGMRAGRFVVGTYSGTNLTETYALFFQFATLLLFTQAERRGSFGWRGLLLGVCAGCCVLLRPNLIAIPLSIAIVITMSALLNRNWRNLTVTSAWIGLGFLIVVGPTVTYFALRGGLAALIDAALRYNSEYIRWGTVSPIRALQSGYQLLSQSGIIILAVMGLGIGTQRLRHYPKPVRTLFAAVVVSIVLEAYFSTMSGRSYAHYLLSWLPIVTVLSAYAVHSLSAISSFNGRKGDLRSVYPVIVAATLAVSLSPAMTLYELQYHRSDASNVMRQAIADYIQIHTDQDDHVLMWGAETSVNFMADRSAPTRYVYQYPLYLGNYRQPSMVAEFLGDLETSPPEIIVDSSASNRVIPPLDRQTRQAWEHDRVGQDNAYNPLAEMEAVYLFIEEHYEVTDTLVAPGGAKWIVYEYNAGI